MSTFNHGDLVYTIDGHAVEYVAKAGTSHIARSIYEQTDYYGNTESFYDTPKVFEQLFKEPLLLNCTQSTNASTIYSKCIMQCSLISIHRSQQRTKKSKRVKLVSRNSNNLIYSMTSSKTK